MSSADDERGGRSDAAPPPSMVGEGWAELRDRAPGFYAACKDLASVPAAGGHLGPVVSALVGLVVDAAATRQDVDGMKAHVQAARSAGATDEEILEALQCAATVGIHAMNVGVPILLKVLESRGQRTGAVPADARRTALREEFRGRRGYWNSTWEELLEASPDMFEAYTRFSSVPWDEGHLSPMVKEFLYIAFDTSATHLYSVGLELHIENALGYGATAEQVLEVMQIASLIGLGTVARGTALLGADDGDSAR